MEIIIYFPCVNLLYYGCNSYSIVKVANCDCCVRIDMMENAPNCSIVPQTVAVTLPPLFRGPEPLDVVSLKVC